MNDNKTGAAAASSAATGIDLDKLTPLQEDLVQRARRADAAIPTSACELSVCEALAGVGILTRDHEAHNVTFKPGPALARRATSARPDEAYDFGSMIDPNASHNRRATQQGRPPQCRHCDAEPGEVHHGDCPDRAERVFMPNYAPLSTNPAALSSNPAGLSSNLPAGTGDVGKHICGKECDPYFGIGSLNICPCIVQHDHIDKQPRPFAWVCGDDLRLQFALKREWLPNARNVRPLYLHPAQQQSGTGDADERERRWESKLAAVWADLRSMIEKHTGKPCEGEPFDALAELLSGCALAKQAAAQHVGAQAAAPDVGEAGELVAKMRDRVARIRYIDESSRKLLIQAADTIERLSSAPTAAVAGQDARDAARYRWLRNHAARQFEHPIVVSQHHEVGRGMRYMGPMIGPALDAAIDAALGAPISKDGGEHGR